MKKILLGLLIVLFIATGCGCGVYAYKYYDLKNQAGDSEPAKMSITDAKKLVNDVCDDMFGTSSSGAKTLSLSYDDYTGEKIDYNNKSDFVKAFMLAAKFAFEDEDIQEKTYYYSTASYTIRDTITYTGKMLMYFELGEDTLELHMVDKNINKDMLLMLDNNPGDGNKWAMHVYSNCVLTGEDGCLVMEIKADSTQVVKFGYAEITFKDDFAGVSSIKMSDLNRFTAYDCDLKQSKKIFQQNITDEEYLKDVKYVINEVSSQDYINTSVIPDKTMDFMTDLYRYLGYIA